jgi:hypothetical protein
MTTDNHIDNICSEAPLKSETLARAECGDFTGIDLEWYHSPRSEWPRLLELL